MPSVCPATTKSQDLFKKAKKHLVGGVNSPVRAFGAVGCTPVFIHKADGSILEDIDGNTYTDFISSWGPMILGHNHPKVAAALQQQLPLGTSYGAPHAMEVELAEIVCERIPSLEKVRMVSSGTEATMSAIRLARGYTKRDKILKFAGCYHGHADAFLVQAGSGALTLGQPSSPGVPADYTQHTLIANFNDFKEINTIFTEYGNEIAAIIVEPIPANMNVIMPKEGFLQHLRDISTQNGALLIFDEVITGFRVHPGGAQALFGVTPDLSTFGKILGGGLPAAAFGGKAEIMAHLAPEGPVYQAGTLSGNPLAMTAGHATLQQLTPEVYAELESKAADFSAAMLEAAQKHNFPLHIVRQGSLLGLHFGSKMLESNLDLDSVDTELYGQFFRHMVHRGNYFAPSAYEACFISAAHTTAQLEQCVQAATEFFAKQ